MDKEIFDDEDWEMMLSWDDENVAFIKPDMCDGHRMWGIYGADGTKLAAADNRLLPLLWPARMIWNPRVFIKADWRQKKKPRDFPGFFQRLFSEAIHDCSAEHKFLLWRQPDGFWHRPLHP